MRRKQLGSLALDCCYAPNSQSISEMMPLQASAKAPSLILDLILILILAAAVRGIVGWWNSRSIIIIIRGGLSSVIVRKEATHADLDFLPCAMLSLCRFKVDPA